jgi:hypothetical protein
MAKNDPVVTPEPEVFPLTVDEFCAELSAQDRRPELIYAFAQDERRAGHVKDLASAYQARFVDFANKPA